MIGAARRNDLAVRGQDDHPRVLEPGEKSHHVSSRLLIVVGEDKGIDFGRGRFVTFRQHSGEEVADTLGARRDSVIGRLPPALWR